MIEVELPDGTILQFPEGTSEYVMRRAIAKLQAPAAAPAKTPEDARIKDLTDQARAAYAAGNDEEGKRLLTEASRISVDSGMAPEGFTADPRTGSMIDLRNDPTLNMNAAESLGFGAMQGLGYNFGDEVMGGMAGAANALGLGDGTDARFATESAREMDRRAQENPLAYYGGMIPGAIGSSLAMGKALGLGNLMQGTTAQRAAAGAMLGGGEGALSGAGGGENAGERLSNAGLFGAVGTVLGGAAPYAIKGVSELWDKAVAGPVASMRAAPSEIRASRALETALRRSGMSADEVDAALMAAAKEGQPEYLVADALGNSGQRMLAGAARTPGDTRQQIVDTLMRRQEGQGGRVAGFLSEQMGAPDTAAQRVASLTTARGQAADAAYDAARGNAAPVDIRGALGVIDARTGGMAGSGVTGDGIDGKLLGYRSRLAAQPGPDGVMRELSDFDRVLGVKQAIQDDIGAAVRAGRNNEARELGKLVKELDAALEASSDMYRTANDEFAKASRVIDAVDLGKASSSSRARSQDVVAEYGNLPAPAQSAYRAGRADVDIARIDAAAPGVNKARPLLSDKATTELGAMVDDPGLLNRRLSREDTMFRTTQAATGGSMTADNLADAAEMEAFNYGPLANLLTGNWRTAASQMGPAVLNTMQGRNTATRDLIAKMLLDRNIKAALAPALAAEKAAGPRRAIVEALARSGLRPATN